MTVDVGIPGLSVDPGSHVCAFYSGDSERDEILIPFLQEAKRAGDRCVCLVDRVEMDTVLKALDREPSTVAHESDWLELKTSAETYTVGGVFDPDHMLDFWLDIYEDAKAKGWPRVRIISEMSWIMREIPRGQRVCDLRVQVQPRQPSLPARDRLYVRPECLCCSIGFLGRS